MDLVSVCSITYNQEDYIETLVNSVKGQTYANVEHIISDDNSSDSTFINLSKLGNVKCYKQLTNEGAAKNFDDCIESASGRYIALLEGDDYYLPEKLEKSLDFLKKNNYDMVCTDITDLKLDGTEIAGWESIGIFPPEHITLEYLQQDNKIYTSTVVAKAEILKDSPGFSGFGYKYVQDYPLFLWLAKRYRIGYMRDHLTIKRMIPTSLGRQAGAAEEYLKQKLYDMEQILNK
jgi:glycosyltransferase involved in cell wall biosynthesis